ncbi:putative protein C2F7,02c [Talaromyces islandicus]|uniref:Mitochondrial import inner membrane translocase subunit TIM50 n=1 Tax=Talaromyces islandicus TaxID=28573 RepID=A0A0U1M462_TALIS|nr:putative protein C2F7,02c [Talaromyces islandicus]
MATSAGHPDHGLDNASSQQPPADEVIQSQPHPSDDAIAVAQSAAHPENSQSRPPLDRPKKKRSLLLVPSRTSSRGSKHQSDMTAETAQDESNTVTNSRTNLTKRRRDRSKASSRRSQRNDQEENLNAKPATPDEDRYVRPAERKPKSTSRFLSILNCCSTSEPDNEDPDLPAKRAETRLPASVRQPLSEKADVSAAESSTAESKDHQLLNEKTGDSVAHQPHAEETQEQPTTLPDSEGKPDLVGEYATAPRSEPSNKQPVNVPGALSLSKKDDTGDEIIPESTPGHAQDDRDTTIPDAPVLSSQEEDDAVPTQDVVPPPQPPPPDVYLPGPPTANGKQNIWLLPPPLPHLDGRKCLILDLDETLVHSSFKVLERADFTIPVEIEGQWHNIYVIKRPGVDQFMKRYGDPLLDQLDIHNVVHHRLFRDSCYNHQGNYVKDLSQVGRDLRETIIIDNSPTSYIFHPQHAIPISSWFSDAHDNELLDLIPVLEDLAGTQVRDVSLVLDVTL